MRAVTFLPLVVLLPLAVACSKDECSDDKDCGATKVCQGKPKKCVFPKFGWGDGAPSVKETLKSKEEVASRSDRQLLPAIDRRPSAVVDRGLGSEIRQMGDLLDKYATSDKAACARLPPIEPKQVKVEGQAYLTPEHSDWVAYCNVLVGRAATACTSLKAGTAPDLQKNCRRFFQQLADAR
jgi:hypothetical protein